MDSNFKFLQKLFFVLLLFALDTPSVFANSRVSSAYSIVTETLDGGGKQTASSNYSHDGSMGGLTGISSIAVPSEVVKAGYVGQLYKVAGFQLSASPATVNEGGSRQLSAAQVLDDDSTLALLPNLITWGVLNGPLSGINTNGLATAVTVYQNTSAAAQGVYAGNTNTLGLTVLDSLPDNFGSYAADGLGDGWQIQYFGQNNPDAAPSLDPDGDGQDNYFEFVAGLIPTNGQSRFSLSIAPVSGQSEQKKIVFDPIVGGRNYMVMTRPDLDGDSWSPLSGGSISDTGNERTVTDLDASESEKFYRVEIQKF